MQLENRTYPVSRVKGGVPEKPGREVTMVCEVTALLAKSKIVRNR